MTQRILVNRRPLQALIVLLYGVAFLTKHISRHSRKHRPVRRVLHVSPAYFGDESYVGGGERAAMGLARAMACDIETKFVSFGPRRRRFKQGSLRVEIYPIRGTVDGSTVTPIAYAFLRELRGADVVHCHQLQSPVIQLSILAAIIMRKRVFLTDHAALVPGFTNKLPINHLLDGYLAESKFSLRVLPSFPRIRMIYGGVESSFIARDARVSRESRVLFVGRLIPHKGINFLIESMPDDIQLDIVGRPYHDVYFRMLQSIAVNKRVRFLTMATDDDIIDAYDRATVTVLPSVYDDVYGEHHIAPELLGLTLVESMARGTPVICTDVGGMPEYVIDGVTGFVVPPNDPVALRDRINYLIRNSSIAREMGRRARQRVSDEFTWEAASDRSLAAYVDLDV